MESSCSLTYNYIKKCLFLVLLLRLQILVVVLHYMSQLSQSLSIKLFASTPMKYSLILIIRVVIVSWLFLEPILISFHAIYLISFNLYCQNSFKSSFQSVLINCTTLILLQISTDPTLSSLACCRHLFIHLIISQPIILISPIFKQSHFCFISYDVSNYTVKIVGFHIFLTNTFILNQRI